MTDDDTLQQTTPSSSQHLAGVLYAMSANNPYGEMERNPICIIPWYENDNQLEAYLAGNTEYPTSTPGEAAQEGGLDTSHRQKRAQHVLDKEEIWLNWEHGLKFLPQLSDRCKTGRCAPATGCGS